MASGPGASEKWTLSLIGENTEPLPFKVSGKSASGLLVYSIDIPKNFPSGGYVVTLKKSNRNEIQVALVNIKPRESYKITEIPSDLKLLALIFAFLTSIFTVVRAKKYSHLSFRRRSVEKKNFFYRFRDERLGSEGNSLARYVALRSGEPLHRASPLIWSLLPWLVIPFGIFTAIKIQFDAAIPNGPVALFFVCAAIGAVDAVSGISLALALGFMHVALGNVTNIRSLVVAVTFTLAWYFPAMIASLVHLTISQDFKKLSPQFVHFISSTFAALIGGISVVISTVLTDSIVVNREASSLLRWPLALMVGILIFTKYSFEPIFESKQISKDENLYLARVVAPGLATLLFTGTMLLVYVWTNQFSAAFIASLVISTPYFLLFVVFPKLGFRGLPNPKRSMIIEALIVVALTYIAYVGIQMLPIAVVSKSKAFILLGLVPNLLHAIYSVLFASAEFSERREEMEAIQ